MIPPSPPGIPLVTAAPPLPPTAVIVTLVTPAGTVTEYVPGVVDEKNVAVLADAVATVNAVVPVTIPPTNSDPASTARRRLPRRILINQHPPLQSADHAPAW
jgi:hypothetical protein